MNRLPPIINVYQNIKSGDFLLQRMAEDLRIKRSYAGYGDLVPVAKQEMEARGAEIILGELDEFERRGPVFVEKGPWTSSSWSSFHRKHRGATVERRTPGQLVLDPIRIGRRSAKARASESGPISVPLPIGNAEFWEVLLEFLENV